MFGRYLSDATDLVTRPLRRPSILLVGGKAPAEKISDIEGRLQYISAHLDRKLNLVRVEKATAIDYVRYAGVASADSAAIPAFVRRRLRWVVDLDHETNHLDGWNLINLGAAISRTPSRKTLSEARRTFAAHIDQLKKDGPRPVYLFGTGPSLSLAPQRSFDDGITIVCNTIVRDRALWHHLAPAFLVAGDPIYHFGHTPHARAFRADALERLRESNGNALFIYPSQFDYIVRSEFESVRDLLIPIPLGAHSDITVDLTRRFSLPPLSNVLTAMLLPVGCTLSNDLCLWGFDGRAPSDSGFWSNSTVQSYPELMQAMRDAHPAFFAYNVPEGNEIQYVAKVHGDLLDESLRDAESRGFRFRMLHRSWTPTFQKRYSEDTLVGD